MSRSELLELIEALEIDMSQQEKLVRRLEEMSDGEMERFRRGLRLLMGARSYLKARRTMGSREEMLQQLREEARRIVTGVVREKSEEGDQRRAEELLDKIARMGE